jgi:hypothetical protein
MFLRVILSAALLLGAAAHGFAQGWVEFESREDRFTATFPGQPTITETTFKSQFGHMLPARIYSVVLAPNHKFTLTVADYSTIDQLGLAKQKACPAGSETCRGGNGGPGNSTGPGYSKADRQGAMTYATWLVMQKGTVTDLLWTNIQLVEGHQVHLTHADKSRTAASIFMYADKLYIAEGTVPPGYPEPSFFYQNLGWLDENGAGVRFQSFYRNGYPMPATQGGGGGGGRGRGAGAGGAAAPAGGRGGN